MFTWLGPYTVPKFVYAHYAIIMYENRTSNYNFTKLAHRQLSLFFMEKILTWINTFVCCYNPLKLVFLFVASVNNHIDSHVLMHRKPTCAHIFTILISKKSIYYETLLKIARMEFTLILQVSFTRFLALSSLGTFKL